MKMFVKKLNWYLASAGGRVIVAMVVDACKYVKMPAIKSKKLLQISQKIIDGPERPVSKKSKMTKNVMAGD